MSTCVNIHSQLAIPLHMLDPIPLIELCHRVNHLPQAPSATDDNDGYTAWWWLTRHGSDHCCIDVGDTHVLFDLGTGRSCHTVRDLRGTLLLICKHMKPGCRLVATLTMSDEQDGFAAWYPAKFWLSCAADYYTIEERHAATPTVQPQPAGAAPYRRALAHAIAALS